MQWFFLFAPVDRQPLESKVLFQIWHYNWDSLREFFHVFHGVYYAFILQIPNLSARKWQMAPYPKQIVTRRGECGSQMMSMIQGHTESILTSFPENPQFFLAARNHFILTLSQSKLKCKYSNGLITTSKVFLSSSIDRVHVLC